ncbi:acetoacetate decarboxylase [Micromonospora pisi]|uniref:Acetoacetate decarboxylase n=1 Tax=Micromonospora pisi TaxID=589240 RepID=A0A495JEQ3_9ACTN|nr:acetoacetate decarboxylase family protein [Micromonospora pisi]RKR86852.1 acetoacetate decarboxylase [Micromonospora pisi]
MTYPPEPWDLRGQMYVSVWAVPHAELPPLPEGLAHIERPVTLGGRGLIVGAWAEYQPGGVLHYREMLAAVLVRVKARPALAVTDIWVDSRSSRDGGRELWGIPKELAELEISSGAVPGNDAITASARAASLTIARCLIRPGRRLPGRWPFRLTVAQPLGSGVRLTPVRGRAELARADTRWSVEPGGPLAYLAHRRPMFTVALRDFQVTFGTAGGRPGGAAG